MSKIITIKTCKNCGGSFLRVVWHQNLCLGCALKRSIWWDLEGRHKITMRSDANGT